MTEACVLKISQKKMKTSKSGVIPQLYLLYTTAAEGHVIFQLALYQLKTWCITTHREI